VGLFPFLDFPDFISIRTLQANRKGRSPQNRVAAWAREGSIDYFCPLPLQLLNCNLSRAYDLTEKGFVVGACEPTNPDGRGDVVSAARGREAVCRQSPEVRRTQRCEDRLNCKTGDGTPSPPWLNMVGREISNNLSMDMEKVLKRRPDGTFPPGLLKAV